jgi:hypothetical protein
LQILFVRLLEGYWGDSTIGLWMGRLGKRIQERQRQNLENKSKKTVVRNAGNPGANVEESQQKISAGLKLKQFYPSQDRLLPTALGNTLRATEDSAGQKYGLNTVEIWPRLYPLISDNLRNTLGELRNQLDTVTRFCITFLACALASLIFYFIIIFQATSTDLPLKIILHEGIIAGFPTNVIQLLTAITIFLIKYSPWLLLPAVMSALAVISYKAAIYVAASYGKSIASAFDLYRFELNKSMHLSLPKTLLEEKQRNILLSSFFINAKTSRNIVYDHTNQLKP